MLAVWLSSAAHTLPNTLYRGWQSWFSFVGAHHISVQTDSRELSLVLLGFDCRLAFALAPVCRLLVLLLLTIFWIILLILFFF